MRATLRRTLEVLATGAGLTALARRAARSHIAVLAYHNVVTREDAARGDASLHLPLPRFIEQIDRLSQTHDVVDLETAVTGQPGERPRAVITFDDAYRGAVRLALPELTRRRLPAIVFVSPALLGTPGTWWDELAEAGLLSSTQRDSALAHHAGRGDAVRAAAFGERSVPQLPHSYGIASLDELQAHCGDHIQVGSHTWAHEYLPALAPADLQQSLTHSLEWLHGSGISAVPWLALPYGGGSPEIGRTALTLGYQGVLRISGGLWRKSEIGRAQVPRINVPAALSVGGLELRTSGLLAR